MNTDRREKINQRSSQYKTTQDATLLGININIHTYTKRQTKYHGNLIHLIFILKLYNLIVRNFIN